MQAFTFEFYVLSLLLVSKYHAAATDLEVDKFSDAVTHEQTTEPEDHGFAEKQDKQTTEKETLKGQISHLELCILCMIVWKESFLSIC